MGGWGFYGVPPTFLRLPTPFDEGAPAGGGKPPGGGLVEGGKGFYAFSEGVESDEKGWAGLLSLKF